MAGLTVRRLLVLVVREGLVLAVLGAIPMLLERLVLLIQEVVEVVEVEMLAAQERQVAQAAQVS